MTEQIEFAIQEQNPTRLKKLLAWLTRFEESMAYDPLDHTVTLVRELGAQVTRLESRVIELEGRSQHAT